MIVQSVRRAPLVLEQPIPVEVAELLHPPQCRFHLRKQLVEQLERPGPIGVLAQQAQEQRGRVDRPVVPGKWRDTGRSELVLAQLVQHLPRFLVVLIVQPRAEAGGEQTQRVGRDIGDRKPGSGARR